jgi:sprouty-related EVH1 domain-containing protein
VNTSQVKVMSLWPCNCNSLHCLSVYSGNYLVRVRAQVMMRDDSTGGWVPMGGGGLSNVSVRKRTIPCDIDECKHEYLIFGKRISDQMVSLHVLS